jgi:cytochrome c biogenesis protein CcmG/thiol:disulfide interchange protein DsbE
MTEPAPVEEPLPGGTGAAPLSPGRRRRHPIRWSVLLVGTVLVLGWAVVAARQLGNDPRLIQSPLLGKPAPAFSLPALEGAQVASTDYAGRLYIVNFWASWCVPCRAEAPHLQAFYERWSPQGVGMVGVVYSDTEENAGAFRDEFGLTYPQAMDPEGRIALDYGVFGVPETYVIDQRGIIMAKMIGAVSATALDQVVSQVLQGEIVSDRNDQYRTAPGDTG